MIGWVFGEGGFGVLSRLKGERRCLGQGWKPLIAERKIRRRTGFHIDQIFLCQSIIRDGVRAILI